MITPATVYETELEHGFDTGPEHLSILGSSRIGHGMAPPTGMYTNKARAIISLIRIDSLFPL